MYAIWFVTKPVWIISHFQRFLGPSLHTDEVGGGGRHTIHMLHALHVGAQPSTYPPTSYILSSTLSSWSPPHSYVYIVLCQCPPLLSYPQLYFHCSVLIRLHCFSLIGSYILCPSLHSSTSIFFLYCPVRNRIRFGPQTDKKPVAEFIDPWLWDKVNSGIGLSYRHARLHGWRAGTTTMRELTFSVSVDLSQVNFLKWRHSAIALPCMSLCTPLLHPSFHCP